MNTPTAQHSAHAHARTGRAADLAPLVRDFDAALESFLRAADMAANLRDAVLYSAMAPGKRMRPALALLACEAAGGERPNALPAAIALELVHAFSLVHDDLPAMDDDDLRRGRPTAHVKFGEAMAILSGDALFSLAFQVIAERCDGPLAGALTLELARGATGMITGQVYDTLGGLPESLDDKSRLVRIHGHKTGALIRAACRMGAISAGGARGCNDRTLAALSAYGEAIGLMFQVVDDLLDVEQTVDQIGKRVNKDQSLGKATYPGLLGVDASRAEVERLRREATAALAPLGDRGDPLRALADDLAVRTK